MGWNDLDRGNSTSKGWEAGRSGVCEERVRPLWNEEHRVEPKK